MPVHDCAQGLNLALVQIGLGGPFWVGRVLGGFVCFSVPRHQTKTDNY